MRMNGMKQPVLVGAMGWSDEMKRRVEALGGVTIKDLPLSRQCVTCQKPLLMMDDAIDTEWVCWADSDAAFVGDCTEWLCGANPDEIVIRRYDPPPADFTKENLAVWKRNIEKFCGGANAESRYTTRVNAPFIVINRKPWQMWNSYSLKWHGVVRPVVDWLLENGHVKPDELPLALRKGWWPFWRALAPAAPWVWRATKLKRRLFKK